MAHVSVWGSYRRDHVCVAVRLSVAVRQPGQALEPSDVLSYEHHVIEAHSVGVQGCGGNMCTCPADPLCPRMALEDSVSVSPWRVGL